MLKTEQQTLLAENFSKALEDSKVAPKTIAEACDITEQAVSNWKRSGKIASQHLPKIANLTGWSVSRLLTGHEPATSATLAANEPSVFDLLTEAEHELLDDFRILIDEDREEICKMIAERARRARAYLQKIEASGKYPLVAKTAAARRSRKAVASSPITARLKQKSLLDE